MMIERTDCSGGSKPGVGRAAERMTIPASEVGLSLTISDEMRKEFDRIQNEIIRAAEETRGFLWG